MADTERAGMDADDFTWVRHPYARLTDRAHAMSMRPGQGHVTVCRNVTSSHWEVPDEDAIRCGTCLRLIRKRRDRAMDERVRPAEQG